MARREHDEVLGFEVPMGVSVVMEFCDTECHLSEESDEVFLDHRHTLLD